MDTLLNAANAVSINETHRVKSDSNVSEDIKKLVQTNSVIMSVDIGQERPMLNHEKHKGGCYG